MRILHAVATAINRYPLFSVTAFTLLYLATVITASRAKPLWFDELFTFYISKLPTLGDLWQAMPLDGHPPGMYLLTRLSQRLFGLTEFATRLPEILASWIACVSVYVFVRRRAEPVFGLLAFAILLILVLFVPGLAFADEARPYAMILGCAAFSLMCWQEATSGTHRVWGLAGIAAGVIAGSLSHYYALIQIVFPLALGEAARTLGRKKIDWPVCAALASAALPLPFLISNLRSSFVMYQYTRNSATFWAHPTVGRMLRFYPDLMGDVAPFAIAGLLIPALLRMFDQGSETERESREERNPFPWHEVMAIGGFLAVPLLILVVTKWRTGYFMNRYAISALIGLPLLLVYVLIAGLPKRAASAVAVCFLLVQGGLHTAAAIGGRHSRPSEAGMNMSIVPSDSSDLVVVANPLAYLQSVHYLPKSSASRLVYLVDLPYALKQPDFLPEYSLSTGRGLFPGEVSDYSKFVAGHDHFWLYYTGVRSLEWLPERLAAAGAQLDFICQQGNGILFRVRIRP